MQELWEAELAPSLSGVQIPFLKESNTVQTVLPSISAQDEKERIPVLAHDKLVLAASRPISEEVRINCSVKLCGAGNVSKLSVKWIYVFFLNQITSNSGESRSKVASSIPCYGAHVLPAIRERRCILTVAKAVVNLEIKFREALDSSAINGVLSD